jgi:hypothetical protein
MEQTRVFFRACNNIIFPFFVPQLLNLASIATAIAIDITDRIIYSLLAISRAVETIG